MQKQHLYLVTLLFLGASTALALSKGGLGNATTGTGNGSEWAGSVQETSLQPETAIGDGIVAYWFHGDIRCDTDRQIEQRARQAIQQGFEERAHTGELLFRAVNTDRPGNGHFNEDFHLGSSALVVVDYHDGEVEAWRNLEQVWDLDPAAEEFQSYVQEEVEGFLNEHARTQAGATY